MRLFAFSILFAATASAWAALPFATAKVAYQNVDKTYSTEATVEAVRQSTVSAQITGRITAVNFDVGDYVKAGQVIVRIDPTELSQAVAGSQAQVAQAEAQLANARANYERQVQLFQQKFISRRRSTAPPPNTAPPRPPPRRRAPAWARLRRCAPTPRSPRRSRAW